VRPFRWDIVENSVGVRADAIVLDWMTASYFAPGVMPRPHAVVVKAREQPRYIVVTATYSSAPSERPSGVEMARTEGRLVGDAIVVARAAGLVLDSALIERRLFEAIAKNERLDIETATREFLEAATVAMKSST
jgi:hypothetical protein